MKLSIVFVILLLSLTSACDTVSQLLLKNSINTLNFNISSLKKIFAFVFKLIFIPRLWLALSFSCLSLLIWLFVLSRADLNLAFSIDSLHYIFIAFASSIILKEKVDFKRWIGTIFIVAGIILVTLS